MNLLCTGKIAEKPYVCQGFQLEIYSVEELCYYLYHNPMFVEEGFLDDTLLAFIRDDCGLPESANRLARYASSRDLTVQMMAVQREFGYYPEERLRDFQKSLEAESRRLPYLRELSRADAVLERRRFRMAIRLYEDLLHQENIPGRTADACAHACLGEAFAYANMGFYDAALSCLKTGYEYNGDLLLVKQAYKLCKLGGLEVPEWVAPESERFPDWEKEYRTEQDRALARVGSGALGEIHGMDPYRREEALGAYLAKKKDDYRKGNDSEGTE